jgi:hypothetical protein
MGKLTGFVCLTAGDALDSTAMMSILCSAAVISTTIQAQDFADVVGDKAIGRLTMPIHFPELSRVITLMGIVAWSIYLARLWHLGTISSLGFITFGTWIGARFYLQRTEKADTYSYALYNVSLSLREIVTVRSYSCFNLGLVVAYPHPARASSLANVLFLDSSRIIYFFYSRSSMYERRRFSLLPLLTCRISFLFFGISHKVYSLSRARAYRIFILNTSLYFLFFLIS